jgi:hypothetical protein
MMRPGRSATVVLFALVGTGCYQYRQSIHDQPVPATVVEVALNDRGRAALENNVGPEVLTVEGTVAEVTDSGFALNVRRVVGIDRQVSKWTGERVVMRNEHVRQIRERRFSAGRTMLFVGSMTASALAFAVTRSILGAGFGDRGGPTPGPGDPGDN